MDGYLDKTVVPILKDVKTMWQPTDFLPDSSSPDFLDQVIIYPGVPPVISVALFCRTFSGSLDAKLWQSPAGLSARSTVSQHAMMTGIWA